MGLSLDDQTGQGRKSLPTNNNNEKERKSVMFEIYNRKTNVVILDGLTYKQAFSLRMMQADRWYLVIRPMETK